MIVHYPNTYGSASALGPRPRLVLDEPTEKELLDSLRLLSSDPAKVRAFERWSVYSENFAFMVRALIDATHFDDEIKRRIHSHIRTSTNLALDITNWVCNVFKHAGASHISVEGARDSQVEALRSIVIESGLYRHARSWNREAFLCGPVTAIPVIRGGRLNFDTLLPHFYSAVDSAEDLWGAPLAAAWDVDPCRGSAGFLHHYGAGAMYRPDTVALYLDGFAWRYYGRKASTSAMPGVPSQDGDFELLGVEEHGVGEFPGATLSLDIAHGGSRWDCDRHQRLIDATVTVAAIEATLAFVRKSQNKKLMTMIGQLEGFAKGQTVDPEKPLVGNAQSPETVAINVLDFDLDPSRTLKHSDWIAANTAKSYGGTVINGEVTFSHEALTELRNEQIPFAVEFLRDLLAKAVATCKAQRHPLYLDLPDPEQVREGLTIKHPPLARSFANVDEQIKWSQYALSRGLYRFEDLLRPSMPEASEGELAEHIVANLEAQAPIIEMMTTRDQSLASSTDEDVPQSETEAQRFGRTGPEARDNPDEDEDDNEDDDRNE